MSVIAIEPIILEDAEFLVEEDDYTGHVSRVELVPTRTQVAWSSLSPASSMTKAGRPTWVANVDGAQDWKTPASLARYLFAHEGEVKTITFKPKRGTGEPAWTVSAQLVAPSVGGAVNTVPVFSVALPVQGQPVPDFDDDPLTPNPAE